jgi:hypothetical protein
MNPLIPLIAQAEPVAATGMTTGAWIFMAVVWAIILLMTTWCFARLMRKEHLAEQPLIGPGPTESLGMRDGPDPDGSDGDG